jgi:hypothetical protein
MYPGDDTEIIFQVKGLYNSIKSWNNNKKSSSLHDGEAGHKQAVSATAFATHFLCFLMPGEWLFFKNFHYSILKSISSIPAASINNASKTHDIFAISQYYHKQRDCCNRHGLHN